MHWPLRAFSRARYWPWAAARTPLPLERAKRSMSGRARLPAGEVRKASQRRSRRAAPMVARINPAWRPGDAVRWQGRAGVFRRDVGDGEHAEVVIADRVSRVRSRELV